MKTRLLGNKKGGISTLEDKSLGCTQKSGSAPVMDVLSYAEQVKTKGLNLLSAPGNDLVASTALAASVHISFYLQLEEELLLLLLFQLLRFLQILLLQIRNQTGSTLTVAFLSKMELQLELSKNLFDFVIDIASGKKSKSEEAGFHDMAIFKQGVTL